MNKEAMLETIRNHLEPVYGERLHGLVLFGSAARGDAVDDSDIDVLVLLTGPVAYGRELRRIVDALFPLSLQWERRISAKPAPIEDYERAEYPLYENAKREGIRV